jgi:hypothetical protein
VIAIAGASGAVGRAAATALREQGAGPLRLGARRTQPLERLAAELGDAGVVHLDVGDPASLAAFCAGTRLVVNCAGPSYRILDRIARAASGAGADYVDACGNARVYRLLQTGGPFAGRAVVSAGFVPGISGLLPRAMALGLDAVHRLQARYGGLAAFTPAAAADYLLGLDGSDGESLAAWRDGRRAPGALVPVLAQPQPFFPGRVSAFPFLSRETERLALEWGLRDAESYAVFAGGHVLEAIRRWTLRPVDLESGASDLARAAELDLAGRRPYHVLVVQLDGERDGRPASCSAVLRATDAGAITGAVAARAALSALHGSCPDGVNYADAIMDPASAVAWLRTVPAVESLAVHDEAVLSVGVEEGVL